MLIREILENRVIAIFCGRFQPPTPAHIAVYHQLVSEFGANDVYITMSNVVDPVKSPLSYDERKTIFSALLGIPVDKILMVKNQYNTEQLQKILHLDDKVAIIFAVGKKDMETNPRFQPKTEEDYTQIYNKDNVKPFKEHMYIYAPSTKNFSVNGKTMKSATEIRNIFKTGTEDQRKQTFITLYGKMDEPIFHTLKQKLS